MMEDSHPWQTNHSCLMRHLESRATRYHFRIRNSRYIHFSFFPQETVFTAFSFQASTVMSTLGSSAQQYHVTPTPGLPSQMTANPQGTSGIQGAASSTDSKSSGRKELPVVRG
jgi:hypothetical protein